jgi:hypothetical protein
MDPLLKLNPQFKLYRRLLLNEVAKVPAFLWVGLVVIICIGPLPHMKEFSEQITMTPRARVASRVAHKKAFIEGAETVFLRDKDRIGFMKQLVTYGIEPEQALQVMNSVTEFADKSRNKNSSLNYAESRRNNLFLQTFGAPKFVIDGLFPNTDSLKTKNGLILLESPGLEPVVDKSSYKALVKKLKNNERLKLTKGERRIIENVRKEKQEQKQLKQRTRALVNPSIPRYIVCDAEPELYGVLRYFLLNNPEKFKFFEDGPNKPGFAGLYLDDGEADTNLSLREPLNFRRALPEKGTVHSYVETEEDQNHVTRRLESRLQKLRDNNPPVAEFAPPVMTPPLACMSLALRGGGSSDLKAAQSFEIDTSDEEYGYILPSVKPSITVVGFLTSPGGSGLLFLFWVVCVFKFRRVDSISEDKRVQRIIKEVKLSYREGQINYNQAFNRLTRECELPPELIVIILHLNADSRDVPLPPPHRSKLNLSQLGFAISGLIGFSVVIWLLQIISSP